MIIRKIILKDFFRYYGVQEFNCNIVDDKNVTIIIGENGRGKTTLLSAFNWVFYNVLLHPLKIDNILNYKAKEELALGDKVDCFVSVEFMEDSKEYLIKRKVEFIKDVNGVVNKINRTSNLEFYIIEKNGDLHEIDPVISSERLLIPKKLKDFFFFDGENISRLAKVDGRSEIKKAILNVLGISDLEQSTEDLEKIKNEIYRKFRRYESKLPSKFSILNNHKKLCEEIESIEKDIDTKKHEIEEANKTIEKLSNIISNSDVKVIKELELRSNNLYDSIVKEKHNLKENEKAIKRHITYNFKYYLLNQLVDNVDKFLEKNKIEGRLPSNIKDTFIDDLIERGKCICGTSLKKGSKEFEAILKIRESAGSQKLDDAYYELKNLISRIKKEKDNFYTKLNYLINEREKNKNNIYSWTEEIKYISDEIKHSEAEEIKEAEEARSLLKRDVENTTKELGVLEENFKIKKNSLDDVEKTLKNIETNDIEIEKLRKQIKITDVLLELNKKFKLMFTNVVREDLDSRIKEVFSKITNKDYRKPVLTNKFELKIVSDLKDKNLNEEIKEDEVLSTGEEQITSLSFIGALVSYAKENKNDSVLSKFSGDDYPIVMDSPFGNLDEIHTKNIAQNIGKLASQVLIIVSRKQWKGFVEENIKEQVSNIYKIEDGEDINLTSEYSIIKEVNFENGSI